MITAWNKKKEFIMIIGILALIGSIYCFHQKDVLFGVTFMLIFVVSILAFVNNIALTHECKELGGILIQDVCLDKKNTIPLNHQK